MRASQRWRGLVAGRLAELRRLRPAGPAGPTSPDSAEYWDANADRFARRFPMTSDTDPVVGRLRHALRPSDTLVDVGAGAGRYAVGLAERARRVTAVEPSGQMLARLRQRAEAAGADNVRCLQGAWPEQTAPGDVVLCAYVLPLVEDVEPFLRAVDRAASRLVLVALSGTAPGLTLEPLWRHFHGRPPPPAPTYLDAVAVMAELALDPSVEVREAAMPGRFANLDEAVADYRSQLFLPDGSSGQEAELRRVLADWLVEEDGVLRPPFATMPVALLSWTPGQGGRGAH